MKLYLSMLVQELAVEPFIFLLPNGAFFLSLPYDYRSIVIAFVLLRKGRQRAVSKVFT